MARRKREFEEDGEESENWLHSYADMITDLLAIFVILFSFAMAHQASVAYKAKAAEESYKEVIESIADTTQTSENVLDVPSPSPALTPSASATTKPSMTPAQSKEPVNEKIDSLFEAIRRYIEDNGLSNDLSVMKQGDNKILVRVKSSVFFASGSAVINLSAEPLLEKISEILETYTDFITMFNIEGHTDDVPIKTSQFDSNWELSTSRAVNVLRRMLEISGLDPGKFSAVGYGEFHPIADNQTEEGRSQNRRVDFIIETVSD